MRISVFSKGELDALGVHRTTVFDWIEQARQLPVDGLVRLAGVRDLDQELAAAFARQAGVAHYADLAAVPADPDVQPVALFTGPAGRAGLIRQAVRVGKHVLTTKPFELDPGAAREVLAEAQRLGRVVQLNSPSPVVPEALAQIAQCRDTLDLGRPVGAAGGVWAVYQATPD
jgi:predicted dehydrogenase